MKQFKFWREFVGGFWVLYDNSHYTSYSSNYWEKVGREVYYTELFNNNTRGIKFEKYVYITKREK